MDTLLHILWQVRMLVLALLLLGGGGAAVWVGVRDFQAAHAESAPTPLSLDTFDRYGGQRWLTIEQGVFLSDQAVVRDLPGGQGNAEDQVILYVPVVERGWKPDSPVHVVGQFGPGPRSRAAGWLQENGDGTLRTFTGVVRNEPPASLFPTLKFREPVLVIREGDHLPSTGLSVGLIGLGIVMFLLGAALGFGLLRYGWGTLMGKKLEGSGKPPA
jgi:hypothetical protein